MEFNIRQQNIINSKEKNILCLATAAAGKAIPCDTLLPTPNGMRYARDIKIGDCLFDKNGHPTKVLGVYPQGEKEVYEVIFGDGRKAKCCEEHLWAVNKITWKDRNSFKEKTAKEMIDEGLINNSRGANFYIPVAASVEYPQIDYLIPPYVIGAFLGDGCCTGDYLTISSETIEIPNKIKELIGADDIYKNPVNYNWIFKKNGHSMKTTILPPEVRRLSYEKSIPNQYKYGSIEQRFELIRGLMDTDGSISKDPRKDHSSTASVKFTSTSLSLVEDVREVLLSLGIVSVIKTDNRTDKYTKNICYELSINMCNQDKYKLFSLEKKKQLALSVKDKKQQHRYDRTSIRQINNLHYKTEMVCFEVDNNEHLYLMNDFIVTHNTRTLIGRIEHLLDQGVHPAFIVAFTFTNQAAEEMRKRLGSKCKGMFIGTLHSYANKICNLVGIGTQLDIAKERFDEILKKANTVPTKNFPEVHYLFVDEFQDTDPLQYRFIEKIPAKNRFYVGDERQFIYSFRGASDQFIRELATDDSFKKYYLVENYRNPPNIIHFADSFLNSMPKISPPSVATITKQGFLDEDCTFMDAAEELTWTDNWVGWSILCRTNTEVEAAEDYLYSIEVPNVIVKRGDLDLESMGNLLEENRVKIMTIHSAKGLEFPNVIVVGAKTFNQEERRISYVAATRAMNSLYWCPTIRTKKGKAKGSRHLAGQTFDKAGPLIDF